jgi:Protein of unknown function (DUF3135)
MPELKTQTSQTSHSLIDFDQWAELAKTDPAGFEARRAATIEAVIQRMPAHKQQRMRCLQWKIDQVRNQASNPMAACIKLSEMMWDSLVGPGGLREVLERVGNGRFEPPPKTTATVLKFHSAR